MDFKVGLHTREELSRLTKEEKATFEVLGIDPRKQFIALQTGGVFDNLPIELRKHLEAGVKIFLKSFGSLVISALELDLIMRLKGQKNQLGAEALKAGLEEKDVLSQTNCLFIIAMAILSR